MLTTVRKSYFQHMLFADQPLEQWVASTGNNDQQSGLFKEAKKQVEFGNTNAAIEELYKIMAQTGPGSKQYLLASHFLSELVTFSEEYVKLYGVSVKVCQPETSEMMPGYHTHTLGRSALKVVG